MTILYVANCTKQIHDFVFRRPEAMNTSAPVSIPPGQQREIARNLSVTDVDYIINQHRAYGMRSEREALSERNFVGLCYSLDNPVTVNTLLDRLTANDALLGKGAAEIRKGTAAAIASKLQSNIQQSGQPGQVERVELEVVEQPKTGSTKPPELAEGVEVVRESAAPRRASGKRR